MRENRRTSAALPVSLALLLQNKSVWKVQLQGLYIWIIHKQLLTQQGPTAQAECMIANSLSHFVSVISTDRMQHGIAAGPCYTAPSTVAERAQLTQTEHLHFDSTNKQNKSKERKSKERSMFTKNTDGTSKCRDAARGAQHNKSGFQHGFQTTLKSDQHAPTCELLNITTCWWCWKMS